MGVAVAGAGHEIDGLIPRRVVSASTEADVVEVVRGAQARGEAIVAVGGGTRLLTGDPPERYDTALDLGDLQGITEWEPGDLVVTVKAGTTLAELAESLSRKRQRWPVEAGAHDRATVGGTIASAAGGPSRLRYHHPRDWVIGARAVIGDGTAVRSGGKVVKNVTGYDLTRLWSGTFGTLAVIVEVTLKLTAVPQKTVTLVAELDTDAALAAAIDLHRSGLPLDALAVVTGEPAKLTGASTDAALVVRVAGPAGAVRRLGRDIRERVRCRDIANDVWDRIAAQPLESEWTARVAWPAGAAPGLEFAGYSAIAYPGNGTAYLLRALGRQAFQRLRGSLESVGGIAVLERAPADYKREVGGAWGRPGLPLAIARALKERFDPRRVLAPGRVPA